MGVQTGGQAPPMKWGWRYLAWAGVPLLAGVLLARYAGPAAPAAVARASVAAEGSWAQHLASPLGLFLLQLLVLLLVAKGAGALLKRFGQPAVIGEMAAGLMMGPLVLGSLLPQLHGALFPASSLGPLGMLSQLGVLMFLLVAGAELDLAALRGRRRFAFTVSHAGIAVPFVLGVALAIWLYPQHGPQGVGFTAFALFVGISMSITAFPVLLRILADRGITQTPLGQTAIACAALGDATAWCLLAGAVLLMLRKSLHVQGLIAVPALAILVLLDALLLRHVLANGPVTMVMGRWLPPFGIAFTADLAGVLFALAGAVVALAGAIHALTDIDGSGRRYGFYPFLLLLMAGVSGAFLTGDIFNLYVWFEVLLISSFGGLSYALVYLGIACFGLSLVFQLVTLPVEFNASHRAMVAIEQTGLLTEDEQNGARKTLRAAALTYVAATATALAQLLRLIVLFGDRGNRRRD